jgi:N-acetylglucosamine kinase-like BadF-type ATPase
MIIIADSGSTKTDWCIVKNKDTILTTSTKGLNPYFMTSNKMLEELNSNNTLKQIAESETQINALYFYGAGLSAENKVSEVGTTLRDFFKQALKISVSSDMLGAARAVLKNKAGVACILGTGSNSCVYDGEKITQNIPALGYVLGDEGSGADLGKRLLQAYFYNELTPETKDNFKKYVSISDDEIIERVYNKPLPNRYLASLSPFIQQNLHDDRVKLIVNDSFDMFIKKHILPYHHPNKTIGFCGSIAYYFKHELSDALNKYNFLLGDVTNKPVTQLVNFHLQTG